MNITFKTTFDTTNSAENTYSTNFTCTTNTSWYSNSHTACSLKISVWSPLNIENKWEGYEGFKFYS